MSVTVTSLTLKKIPVSKLTFSLRSANQTAEIPFNLDIFGGTVAGTAKLDFRKTVPPLHFTATARNMKMEEMSHAVSDKTTVSGKLSADADVTGQGNSWKEIAPPFKGKAPVQVLQGEGRGFSLIPPNLRGVGEVPVNFPFERISGSARIDRGIANRGILP